MAEAIKGSFDPATGRYKAGIQQARGYINRSLSKVEGYLTSQEASLLAFVNDFQRANNIRGDLVDIGVWRGRVTLMLASLARATEKVVAVDLFDLREASHKQFNDPAVFLNNVEELGLGEKVQVVKADTVADRASVIEAIGERRPRLIYIDGGHDYETVRNDLSLALDIVADKGVVVCNDFMTLTHPAVTEAVVEEVRSRDGAFCAFMLNNRTVWLCSKKSYNSYYTAAGEMFVNAKRSPRIFGRNARLLDKDKSGKR